MTNEFPDFIIQAISDVVSQYMMEYDIKDKNIILRFSNFSESVVSNMNKEQEKYKSFHNEDFVKKYIDDRKKLIKDNLDLYKQLEHLEKFHIPEHIIDSVVIAVNEIIIEHSNDFSDFENRDFYCLFGENLVLDIRNYMQLHKVKQI